MNEYAAKYGGRGLVVFALQVRRDPEILAENIVHWLESIKPAIPVFRCGWNPEWPTRTLPWVILFDHEGREVFAGKPEGIEPVVEKTLADAPDSMIGGPYSDQKALAASIVANRGDLGLHVARLRAIENPDAEVRAMIGAAEAWFARQADRIREDMPGVVEQADAWDALARTYAGDRLGERAAEERDTLRAAPAYTSEAAAHSALRRARATFRRCPPRGGYFPYHFTRINYTVIDDPTWVATRVRMTVEFRIQLARIVEDWPDTYAAEESRDLLFVHDVPALSADEARDRVERAARLLEATGRPAELYEAWLLLAELRAGYFESDEISRRAEGLFSSIEGGRAKDLVFAEAQVRALREEAETLYEEVEKGGSLLSLEKANDIMARLKQVAERSGGETLLARRIATYIEELAAGFEGAPRVGVRLDPAFPGPGVRIALVENDTGAASAGLKPGDVILKFGETELSALNDFTKTIAARKPGEVVRIEVRRADGEVLALDLPLGRRPR